MNTLAFLQELHGRDIRVWADGDQLRCNAPAGVLTPELRDQLLERKRDIVKFLHAAGALAEQQEAVVPFQAQGARAPIFAVAGHNGDVFCYRELVKYLGADQPFFGLQPPGLDRQSQALTTVESLAAYFARQILAFRPTGPYVIAGYCAGGTVAFELARQLARQGARISFVTLFGSPHPTWYRRLPQLHAWMAAKLARVSEHIRALGSLETRQRFKYLAEEIQKRKIRHEVERRTVNDPDPLLALRAQVAELTLAAVRRYTPGYFPGPVSVFLPSSKWQQSNGLRWDASLALSLDEYCGPAGCDGYNMLHEPYVSSIAELFKRRRDGIQWTPQESPQAESKGEKRHVDWTVGGFPDGPARAIR